MCDFNCPNLLNLDDLLAQELNLPGLELLDFDEQIRVYLATSRNLNAIYFLARNYFLHNFRMNHCFNLFEYTAENNIFQSFYFLGKFYYEGISPIKKDSKKAEEYFLKYIKSYSKVSSNQNQSKDENPTNKEDPTNKENPTNNFEKESYLMFSYSYFYLGYIYEDNYDSEKAYSMFQKSASHENFDAVAKCAYYQQFGIINIEPNYLESMKAYYHASEKGSTLALSILGFNIDRGVGCIEDNMKAFEYYSKSAIRGNLVDSLNAGLLLRFGRGIEIDKEQGIDLIYASYQAIRGKIDPKSSIYSRIFQIIEDKACEISHTFTEQEKNQNRLFNSFCSRKCDIAIMIGLIGLIFNGYGLRDQDDRGFNCYLKSYLLHDSIGTRNLSFMYEKGKYIEKDLKQTKYLTELSLKNKFIYLSGTNYERAGFVFFEGKVCKRSIANQIKGLIYLKKALQFGFTSVYDEYQTKYRSFFKQKDTTVQITSVSQDLADKSYSILTNNESSNSQKQEAMHFLCNNSDLLCNYLLGKSLILGNFIHDIEMGKQLIEQVLSAGYIDADGIDICYDCAVMMDKQYYLKKDTREKDLLMAILEIGDKYGVSSISSMYGYAMNELSNYSTEDAMLKYRRCALNSVFKSDYASFLISHYSDISKIREAARNYKMENKMDDYKLLKQSIKNIMN